MHVAVILNFLTERLSHIASNPGQTLLMIFSNLSLHRFKKPVKFSENYESKSMSVVQYCYLISVLVTSQSHSRI